MTHGGTMAFPVQASDPNMGDALYPERGLTKREYAAIKLLAALLVNDARNSTDDADWAVAAAVRLADKLMEKL